ncbi:hypothetical protein [Mycoplasma sp. P36-A1]|uniref:hypothetical protein n=1 Tax=Mycoplasma sp. P36-A1 TaxID=3252900 RepID=UPI003C2B797E
MIKLNKLESTIIQYENTLLNTFADYYINNDFIIKQDFKKIDNYTKIYGTIDHFSKKISTEIKLSSIDNTIEATCDCDIRYKNQICEHVMAYLKNIYSNEKTINKDANNELTKLNLIRNEQKESKIIEIELLYFKSISKRSRDLVNYYKKEISAEQNAMTLTNKIDLHPILELNSNNKWTIRYMIGNDRLYYIKDIETFLENVEYNVNFKYGNELELVHSINIFSDNSKLQYKLIKVFSNMSNKSKIEKIIINKKSILLNKETIDIFFEFYKLSNNDIICEEVNEKIDIHIYRNRLFHNYHLNLNHNYILSKFNLYKIENNNKIKKIDFKNKKKTIKLLNILSKNNFIVLQENLDEFKTFVTKDIIQNFNITYHVDNTF